MLLLNVAGSVILEVNAVLSGNTLDIDEGILLKLAEPFSRSRV